MPSGNVTLLEAAKCGSDQLKTGVVETIIQENPLIELMPWRPFAGNALKHGEEGTLPSVNFRAVNEGYSASWGSDNEHFWGVAILGGEIKVDRFLVDVVGSEQDIEAKQWTKLAKANALRFGYEAIYGTGSVASKGFKGMQTLIDEGHGQKIIQASGGGALTLDKIDEAHDLFRNQGMPEAGLCTRFVRRKITALARSTATGISLIDVGTDVFGRKVNMYNDVALRILGDSLDSSGNVVPNLSATEDPGDGGLDTQSIYWIKFGEDDVTGLLGLGGSFQVQSFGELETAPQRMGRMEWYPGIAIFNKYSVVRHYGILAS